MDPVNRGYRKSYQNTGCTGFLVTAPYFSSTLLFAVVLPETVVADLPRVNV